MKHEKFLDEIPHAKEVTGRDKVEKDSQSEGLPLDNIELNVLVQQVEEEEESEELIHLFTKPTRFILTVAFNLGPVYFFFSLLCFKNAWQFFKRGNRKHLRKYLWFVTMDLLLSLNVLCIFGIFFAGLLKGPQDQQEQVYFSWSISCILFITIFTLFVTWKECMMPAEPDEKAENKPEKHVHSFKGWLIFMFSLLLEEKNLKNLCLGLYQFDFLLNESVHKTEILANHTENFKNQMEEIIRRNGIDQTLVYFSLIKEQQEYIERNRGVTRDIKPEPKSSKTQRKIQGPKAETVLGLRSLGFYGTRHIIDDMLLPLYIQTRIFAIQDYKSKVYMAGIIILAKVLVPTGVLVRPINPTVIFMTLMFGGFYMHFVSICALMNLNDDLRTRNYFLKIIKKLIDIQEYMSKESEKGKEKEKEKEKDKDRKEALMIDISCPLSLQSWDTMRQITLQIDKASSSKYSFLFGFLVLYGKICFIACLCCSLKVTLFQEMYYCKESIILYNMHCDVLLIALICLIRIQKGNEYNETFGDTKELIYRLAALYEDLSTLFEFYFTDGVSQIIKNQTYRSVVQMIMNGARFKAQKNSRNIESQSLNEEEDEHLQIAREKIQEMKEAMEKISEVVDMDRKNYEYKFLGHYHLEFKQALKIVIIVIFSFVPSLFRKMWKYFDQMAG